MVVKEMQKNELITLLSTIDSFFPGRFEGKKVISVWWEKLKDYDFDRTMHALNRYVEHGTFPPTISDLIQEQASRKRAESNQTVGQVLGHIQKSEAEIKKEYEEKFSQSGFKMVWEEPEEVELPEWLKKREAERRGRTE
jgi:hypothetical protein